jgi:signal transduction histidine kinase
MNGGRTVDFINMGNALRLFVFCLALAAVGSTAALSQLWVRQRAKARQQAVIAQRETSDPRRDLQAYHADQQKVVGVIVAVSFVSIFVVALAAGSRRGTSTHSAADTARSRGDMHQVEHLARTAVVREEALRREREERQRADENLQLQQLLMNQALGEKIRLGRDLHDGVIQSLYATGLTFESSRQKRPSDPATADTLFERGLELLNASIRETRSYINSLSHSQPVMKRGFSSALTTLLENIKGDRSAEFVMRIDEDAETRIHLTQMPDVLQIVREAASNALRHGGAKKITIRLHEDGEHLALMVQDDGSGFDPATASTKGHGLANFRARAASLQAEFRIDSSPGQGTRLVLTFPALPSV